MKAVKILLLSLLLVLTIGCQFQGTLTDQDQLKSEVNEQLFDANIHAELVDWLPKRSGFSWTYQVAPGNEILERVIKIENSPDQYTYKVYTEGVLHHAPTSQTPRIPIYDKVYEVNGHHLYERFGEKEVVMMRGPLSKFSKWETPFWLDHFGWVDVVATITSLTDQEIEVTYATYDNQIEIVTLWKKNEGIIKKQIIDQTEAGLDEKWVLKSAKPTNNQDFISRIMPQDTWLKLFYQRSNSVYDDWVYTFSKSVATLSVLDRQAKFVEALEALPKDDPRVIRVGLEMTQQMIMMSGYTDWWVNAFVDFHEKRLQDLSPVMMTWLTKEQLLNLYVANANQTHFEYQLSAQLEQPEMKVVLEVLKENGIGMQLFEGIPTLVPYHQYTSTYLSGYDDVVDAYLELLKVKYKISPVRDDGMLRISWEDMMDYRVYLEQFVSRYPDFIKRDDLIEDMSYVDQLIFSPVTGIARHQKFVGGSLTAQMQAAFLKGIERHAGTQLFDYLVEAMSILQNDAYLLTSRYTSWLMRNGWVYDTLDAEQIKKNERAIMVYRAGRNADLDDLPSETVLETVVVNDFESLVKAIKPNTRVLLKAGTYQVVPFDNTAHVKYEYDQMTIHDLENLHILADDLSLPVTIIGNQNGFILRFEAVSQVTLKGLRFGHAQNQTDAGIIRFNRSDLIDLSHLVFFGNAKKAIELVQTGHVKASYLVMDGIKGPAVMVYDADLLQLNQVKIFEGYPIVVSGEHLKRLEVKDLLLDTFSWVVPNYSAHFNIEGTPTLIEGFEVRGQVKLPELVDEKLRLGVDK